jgi:hypothetical protein
MPLLEEHIDLARITLEALGYRAMEPRPRPLAVRNHAATGGQAEAAKANEPGSPAFESTWQAFF